MSVALWTSAFVGIRAAGRDFGAGPLAAGGLCSAALPSGIVATRREPLPRRRDIPLMCWCGLLWFALYNVALNAGKQHVDAGTASMIIRLGPILVAVLAGLLLGEGFSRDVFVGGAIAFAGTAVLAAATADGGQVGTGGVLLCLVAAFAYAGGVVTEKVVLRRVSPLQTVSSCCLVGAVACLPFVPALVRETSSAAVSSIVWLAYLGLFPTALGFTGWAYVLARYEAARLSLLVFLGPPISIVLALLLLDETPPALALIGGAICLAGVAVSQRAGD